jgi:hypothetical protein
MFGGDNFVPLVLVNLLGIAGSSRGTSRATARRPIARLDPCSLAAGASCSIWEASVRTGIYTHGLPRCFPNRPGSCGGPASPGRSSASSRSKSDSSTTIGKQHLIQHSAIAVISFDSLSDDGEFEWLCVHATVIRARQHANAGRRQKGALMPKALGRSKAGLRAKLLSRPTGQSDRWGASRGGPEYNKLCSWPECSSCCDAIRGPLHAQDWRRPRQLRARASADRSRRC